MSGARDPAPDWGQTFMLEMKGNLWTIHDRGCIIVVTTNGVLNHQGRAVMGRGVAKQAADRFPNLPWRLGDWIRYHGNYAHYFESLSLITMPVKHYWHQKADLNLIARSAEYLMQIANVFRLQEVYMPRPGCGNGNLQWRHVKPVIELILDDRFTVVEYAR
jgi:hypothetical protein